MEKLQRKNASEKAMRKAESDFLEVVFTAIFGGANPNPNHHVNPNPTLTLKCLTRTLCITAGDEDSHVRSQSQLWPLWKLWLRWPHCEELSTACYQSTDKLYGRRQGEGRK